MHWNTKLVAASLMVLWSIGPLFAAGVGGDDADKELKKLQGTWVMVSGEVDGKKVGDEHVNRSKIVYDGNKGQLVTPHQSGETIVFDIIKFDPTKTPKEMHFARRNGPAAGKTIVGVYEFDGDDLYKFAFDPAGLVTIKEFVTKEGTGHIRHSWKRVKPQAGSILGGCALRTSLLVQRPPVALHTDGQSHHGE
jgi:uncharacterized protein (TIGR03067 family)